MNTPQQQPALTRSEYEAIADAHGLTIADGDNRRGPDPFTNSGEDGFVWFYPELNGSNRDGSAAKSRREMLDQFGVSHVAPSSPKPSKSFDTRSLEERGLTPEARRNFGISGPLEVESTWGEKRHFPTFHADGTEARHRDKFRDPSRQPTTDKDGKPRHQAKTLWDSKTKSKRMPPAYGLNSIEQSERVYLVNSELAVWLFWQHDLRAICPLGEGRNEKSFAAIIHAVKDAGAAALVVLLDADATGQKATTTALKAAQSAGLPATAKRFPNGVKSGYDASDFEEANRKGDLKSALDALEEHTEPAEAPARFLAVVETANRQLRDASAEALDALKKSNTPPRIFMRAAIPVRVGCDEHDRPVIERIGEGEMRHELTRAADFERTHAKGVSAVAPPLEIVRDILATPALPFPPLIGIAQTPTIRPDGSVLDVPGYDPATRLLFAPQRGAIIPQVPTAPTDAQVKAARELILELFADFPFAEDSSRAAAVALALTPIVRPAIIGPVPLAIADATQAGTGKGLLTNVVAMIATGHPAAVEHAPANEEEWDKRITATLREAPALIALDDVSELKSASLARALTANEYKGRVLGRSENVILPQRAAWVATGNNIRLGGDIPRRCYWIRLDAQTSRPWERGGFKHPDLLKWVRDNRAKIVIALLTLARAWFAAGCPAPTVKPIGSYEDWTRIIGGILQHAEISGFLDNLPALYDAADDETPEWEAFLDALHGEFGSREITVAQIHERARNAEAQRLRESLPGDLADQIENAGRFRRMLGKALAKRVGRRYGEENLHICRAADDSHAKIAQWKVKSAGLAGFAGLVSPQREALIDESFNKSSHGCGTESTPQTPLTPQIFDDSIFDDEPTATAYGND